MKANGKLRQGFTTGTCAAAATAVAARILLSEGAVDIQKVKILTPNGIRVTIPVEQVRRGPEWAECAVKKDSGDDPDVTNGVLVYSKVEFRHGHVETSDPPEASEDFGEPAVVIRGGKGIGVVTKPGLACNVGEAAINPVPRQMIRQEAEQAMEMWNCAAPLTVTISIPEGVDLAAKTFNPRLGIEGGISVLGTSGIVEPMSEQALIDTIKVELNMKRAEGLKWLVITPGNYGEAFLKERPELADAPYVKCSNFIGDTIKHAKDCGFQGILLTGHIGKLIKVAAGMMNTHSRYGDKRMETLTAYAQKTGVNMEELDQLRDCVTTEEAVDRLRMIEQRRISRGCGAGASGASMEYQIMNALAEKIKENLTDLTVHSLQIETVLYSNRHGFLGQSSGTAQWLRQAQKGWRR